MEISLTSPFAAEEMKAKTALLQVLDPELNINIIDLGLVYNIDFSVPEKTIVNMTLSTPHCPLGDSIQNGIAQVLVETFPNRLPEINLVWEPEWNYDMISEDGKAVLGLG